MSVTWQDIAFQLDPALAQEVADAWSWLVPEPWEPMVCSMVAGIFLRKRDGEVHWLDTGTGLVRAVASSPQQFEEIIRTSPESVEDWFLPPIVKWLHAAGKRPQTGECYGFIILPVFAEGKYDVDNMVVLPVREQFVGIADVHRQLSELPADQVKVQIRTTD